MTDNITLTEGALPFVQKLLDNAKELNVEISTINEATVIDCGINVEGSADAALLFINISLGGLGKVSSHYAKEEDDFMRIEVSSKNPVLATLGCQAASWNINKGDFFGMACGPGRALAKKPSKVFKLLEYSEKHEKAILCIESDMLPPEKVVEYIAEKCNVEKRNLTLIMIKTACKVSYMQMAARAIEIGMFRLVEQLGHPKEDIVKCNGLGLVAPFSPDADISNDRINNALIYGTILEVWIASKLDADISQLLPKIASKSSPNYGKRFLEVFNEAGQNFANFDLSLIAPSEVTIASNFNAETYHDGKIDRSFLKD